MLIASLFEKRAPGLYHNTAAIFDTDGALGGIYRKMHIPDDPLYYEKFYFTPGDLGFKALILLREGSARLSAGTSGIPKARGSPHYRERAFFFILRRSDGIPPRRPNLAKRSMMPGARFSGRMRLRTAFMWAW